MLQLPCSPLCTWCTVCDIILLFQPVCSLWLVQGSRCRSRFSKNKYICLPFEIISIYFCSSFPCLRKMGWFFSSFPFLSYHIIIRSVIPIYWCLSFSYMQIWAGSSKVTCRYNTTILTVTLTELRLSALAGRALRLSALLPPTLTLLFPYIASPLLLHSFLALIEQRRSAWCPL